MKVLQVSPPKAGSFWLHTILKSIFKTKQLPLGSYIQQTPQFEHLKNRKLSFREQAGVDMIDIEEEGIYFRVSSIYREKISNMKEYSSKATLAWTHSTYCSKTPAIFRYFEKKVIIVRDPRDRALSAARFAFTPYMQKHYSNPYPSPEEFLEGEYERLLEQWVWFYGNYLLHHQELNLHFVFYERLLKDFQFELDELLTYLNVSLNSSEKAQVARAVSFSNMKEESPGHLQKGKSRKWVDQLSQEQQKKAAETAGFLMDIFNYPLSASHNDTLPEYPKQFPEKDLLKKLEKINWKNLYPTPKKTLNRRC
jgi:aryl sulfotransferase